MISTTYPVCEAGKWCPHTDSNRGPPDYKTDIRTNTLVYASVPSALKFLKFNALSTFF